MLWNKRYTFEENQEHGIIVRSFDKPEVEIELQPDVSLLITRSMTLDNIYYLGLVVVRGDGIADNAGGLLGKLCVDWMSIVCKCNF